MEKKEQEQNRSARVVGMLCELMKWKSFQEEVFNESPSYWNDDRKAWHLNQLNRMVELVHDDTLPLYAREYLVYENIRHFDCMCCGKTFTSFEAYLLLKGGNANMLYKNSGDKSFGYHFACCDE
jgi:hypothetical protein